jgi:hypothetical protein
MRISLSADELFFRAVLFPSAQAFLLFFAPGIACRAYASVFVLIVAYALFFRAVLFPSA